MHIIEASILLITLIIISTVLSNYIRFLPTALIQIALGVVVALLFNVTIDLASDWFMLLFVAPLLFNDAKRFPKKELWELKAPIFANAILLVFLTTIVGGLLIHKIIPALPLSLSMALAAVLSPTDPVAVNGIAEQVHLPKRVLSLISGESLINDASGLIAFKYALAAFLTGKFSLLNAAGDFFYMALVGMLVGYIFISFIHFLRIFLVQQGMIDAVLHTAILLVTPFLIYILTDEVLHASGVIAVVTAGVMSLNQPPIFQGRLSEIHLVTNKTWEILIYVLNGSVFGILGIELPFAMRDILMNPTIHNLTLLGYIFFIWFVLLATRIIWSYSYLWYSYWKKKDHQAKPSFFTALLTGLTGVRGAVTMASIMSIPVVLANGKPFSERSLLIFLACGVILLSLVVATILLPILTKQRARLFLSGDSSDYQSSTNAGLAEQGNDQKKPKMSESEARIHILRQAVQTLLAEEDPENKQAISELLHEFNQRLHVAVKNNGDDVVSQHYLDTEQKIRRIAIDGEFAVLQQALEKNEISEKVYKRQKKRLKSKQKTLPRDFQNLFFKNIFSLQRRFDRIWFRLLPQNSDAPLEESTYFALETQKAKGAIQALRNYKKEIGKDQAHSFEVHLINQLLAEYRSKIERIHAIGKHSRKHYQYQLQEYYLKALDAERGATQELFENGQINFATANNIRQSLNYAESSLLQEER